MIKCYYDLRERISPTAKINKHRINLIWWDKHKNLGDYLSVVVYNWALEKYGLDHDKRTPETKAIMGIGSIIMLGNCNSTIWGSGILSVNQIPFLYKKSLYRSFDIRAVRGPVTRNILSSFGYACPATYGDPAILMPYIYEKPNLEVKYEVSVIEHYAKSDGEKSKNINYISIETTDYKSFINEVVSSKKIISSSLHGIIIAESYGVPAIFWNKNMDAQMLKFYDWYLSTGRTDVRMALSLEEALECEPMPLPDLHLMQERLIDSFPVDLWNEQL